MAINLANRIEIWPIDRLKPYEKNARTHSQDQVDKIAASILEFGFNNPILVDSKEGIIAGHGRLMAAKQLQLKEVPIVVLDHLNDAQRRAYIIADNRLALDAGWDNDLLEQELRDLEDDGFDLDVIGFSEEELKDLLNDEIAPSGSGMPELKSGDKDPFQQMTFIFHDSQIETVKRAMALAKSMGSFADSVNQNSNGNALARICETFLTQNGGEEQI